MMNILFLWDLWDFSENSDMNRIRLVDDSVGKFSVYCPALILKHSGLMI